MGTHFIAFFSIFLWVCSVGRAAAEPTSEFSVVSQFSTNLRASEPLPAFGAEASFSRCWKTSLCLRSYAKAERTLEDVPQWTLPVTTLSLFREWAGQSTLVRFGLTSSALEIHRWGFDGGMVRLGVASEVEWEFARGWFADARLSPFSQANAFILRTDGRTLPAAGFHERLSIRFERFGWRVALRAIVEQQHAFAWSNVYSIAQLASKKIHQGLHLGLGHVLLTSVIDSSTGATNPFRWTDSEESRFFVFLEYVL